MELFFDRSDIVDVARRPLLEYAKKLRWSHARILFVVDAGISLSPGANAFGVERVIRVLRESTVGCMHFHVDAAVHSSVPFAVVANPPGTEAKYLGFKFDSKLPNGALVIDQYDEVWCFGASGPNTNDDELAALTTWMNGKKGGLFATGDHETLGASMCSRIPRVGTMRAWTNAQGVPSVGGAGRIDTNRPFNAAEEVGAEVIEFSRQGDTKPQPIDWVTWMHHLHFPFQVHRRPHPVLCHPTLGPINVMPDHPHEGVVFDHVVQPDVGLAAITLGNAYDFSGVAGDEYPTLGTVRPLPMVIAHGKTLADPPLWHEKGDSPAKRFAMINVYDGHRAGIGRVATDSTWHHWMNINITELEAAGGTNWEKIKRYYLNLAVWLAPPHVSRTCFHLHVLESFFAYPGIEEFSPKRPTIELGASFRAYLLHWHGSCWVTQFLIDRLTDLSVSYRERWMERYLRYPQFDKPFPPRPDPCLSCPTPDLFEAAVLGGIVKATAQLFDSDLVEDRTKWLAAADPDEIEKVIREGSLRGLQELNATFEKSLQQSKRVLSSFEQP